MSAHVKIIRQYDSRMKVVGDLTQKNWERYADKHGYGLETRYSSHPLPNANWRKLIAMRDSIDPTLPHLFSFWADADSAVSNMGVLLEPFVEGLSDDIHILLDVSQYGLSTGNWFARNTNVAHSILSAAITLGVVSSEVNAQLAKIDGGDESVFKYLIAGFPAFAKHVRTVPTSIADFPRTHTPEKFCLHAAQRSESERLQLLSPYCQ